jgi:N-acetylglucosaminyl-diphospho-decaprenol L-rhamnosyltransferase
MRAVVVIPTLNARELLAEAIASVEAQTVPVQIIVVDNASSDGTAEMLADRFPRATVVRNEENLGFGRAVNRGVAEADDADVVILVNNDAVCAPDFVAQLLAPFADPAVGMVAGVLVQGSAPELVDSAGIELDTTLGSWDYLWNRPVSALANACDPVGPCGGAAA